jgi:RNA polymerase sigma factor (sigma-70 family)
MDFQTLFRKISPVLKQIARSYKTKETSFDADDLYQEMCIHLWNNFKYGLSSDMNVTYIIKGCVFHILNFLRKERRKVVVLSLEDPVNENGDTLRDVIPDKREPLDKGIDRHLTIEEIRSNGFTRREKEVFALLLKGYTTREVGQQLGISHVRVVRLKQRIVRKWHQKSQKRKVKK